MAEPIEVQNHNRSFAHLVMQKQSGNGMKGRRSGKAEKGKQPTKKKRVNRQNINKGAMKFIEVY